MKDFYNDTSGEDYLDYEFFSIGPNGTIKKVVQFASIKYNGFDFYNLSMCDCCEETQSYDDSVTTNNGYVDKILATVAAIVIDFTGRFPEAMIYAVGNTPSQNRLYQIGINKAWNIISALFEVIGINSDGTMEYFQKNVKYVSFWVTRK